MKTKKPARFLLRRAFLFFKYALLPLFIFTGCVAEKNNAPPEKMILYEVKSVSSVSHIALSGGRRIRLIGVESGFLKGERESAIGGEAVQCLKKLLVGREIAIESGAEERDLYGAKSAYVFFTAFDEKEKKPVKILLNAFVIEQGWGVYKPDGKNGKYADELFEASERARNLGNGVRRGR